MPEPDEVPSVVPWVHVLLVVTMLGTAGGMFLRHQRIALSGGTRVHPPRIEQMLAVQMIATHSAAMWCLRLATLDDQTFDGRELFLKHAGKLMRSYTAQVEALGKYRNKAK